MNAAQRAEKIVAQVTQHGFRSVKELSRLFGVSEVTMRRDLQRLHDAGRLLRTYGGAAPLVSAATAPAEREQSGEQAVSLSDQFLIDQIDVLMTVSVSPRSDRLLAERAAKHRVPIIAESLAMEGAATLVAVDNFVAAQALGHWTADYVRRHFDGQAHILNLTYHLTNTHERSRGFLLGIQERLPDAKTALTVNTQADIPSAYRLTSDALQVYPEINVIFGINDTVVIGAIQACRDAGIAPESIVVVTFGLEGDTSRNELMREEYLKAGLAMFPEIVGPTCVEAAIAVYHGLEMPPHLVTPHAVLTTTNIGSFYERNEENWQLRTGSIDVSMPLTMEQVHGSHDSLPASIGFLVPFGEHEWYINLAAAMEAYARKRKIDVLFADSAENLKDELVLRKLGIAAEAARLIEPGDVILIDGGQVTTFLADALVGKQDITVITNSMAVIDVLRREPGINLISTGGLLGHQTQTFTGPTAESVFRELRSDKLFLAVAGVSLDFGLSHTNLAEVALKQAMIRTAREVILLADHAKFEQESVVQVASLDVVDKLITDNGLPASTRLDLSEMGIEILLANS